MKQHAQTVINIMFLSPEKVVLGMLMGMLVFIFCSFFLFKHMKWQRKTCVALLFIYIGAVISLTIPIILPSQWNISSRSTSMVMDMINWIPVKSSMDILRNSVAYDNMHTFIRLIIGNFIMLMPLGILVPLIFPKIRFWRMLFIACATAMFIEGLQLVVNILAGQIVRSVEIDDFILNSSGCMLSYSILSIFRKIVRPVRRKIKS